MGLLSIAGDVSVRFEQNNSAVSSSDEDRGKPEASDFN